MSNEYAGMVQRLWQRDISLWAGASSSEPVARRLGWLDAVSFMEKNNPELTTWAHQLAGKNQFDTLLLLGMGGSSLAPQVISSIVGSRPGFPRLVMRDTTSPRRPVREAPSSCGSPLSAAPLEFAFDPSCSLFRRARTRIDREIGGRVVALTSRP